MPKQVSAQAGRYTNEYTIAMDVFITACIDEENRCYDALELATTKAEIEAVTATYPEVVL